MTRRISSPIAPTIGQTLGRVAAGVAALSMIVAAGSASADPRGRYRHHDNRDSGRTEAAIVAGVVGLALGAALASNNNDRYDRYDRYDRRGYAYAPPPPPRYGYGDGYERPYRGRGSDCWTTRDYDRRSGVVYERTVCR